MTLFNRKRRGPAPCEAALKTTAQAEEARCTMPERVKISTDHLDAWLYRPLEHHAPTSPLPRFERLSDSGLRTADVDVLLHEGVATSNILELPSCQVYRHPGMVSLGTRGQGTPAGISVHRVGQEVR